MAFRVSDSTVKTIDCAEYLITPRSVGGQNVNMYFQYRVIAIEGVLSFIVDRTLINSEGFIINSESKVSSVIPENITSTTNVNYEYNPKDLKIEAPIKTR